MEVVGVADERAASVVVRGAVEENGVVGVGQADGTCDVFPFGVEVKIVH